MNAYVYKLTCITNLHVGNGEMNFDVIDNTVERDPVLQLPTINSSGVKGAFRQFFSENHLENVTEIFGSDVKVKKQEGSFPGQVKFYQANLLARPMRASKGSATHYMTTSKEALEQYVRTMRVFGNKELLEYLPTETGNLTVSDQIGVEGIHDFTVIGDEKVKNWLKALIAEDTLIMENEQFSQMPLPVMARNQLENGISRNLWYEEVVPHKSIFTIAVSCTNQKLLNAFDEAVNKKYIQFGGNASIGYGLCLVERISGEVKTS
ncbi:MAG: type III-B CRISPR module RAMP protein Cmr4 [Oscillospiraceae bacterium]|nr:type III-B CRISPR module RAMP protein Cmr4 [Oscillospiraceae bacterium]